MYEILDRLDKIVDITEQIFRIYQELIYLEINKQYIAMYDERVKVLCESLSSYKEEECDFYSTHLANQYIEIRKKQTGTADNYRLYFSRIHNRLVNTEVLLAYQEEELPFKDDMNDNSVYRYLIESGLSYKEADDFTNIILPFIELNYSSIKVALFNEKINKAKNENERILYIRLKYRFLFTAIPELETEYINHAFNGNIIIPIDNIINPNVQKKYISIRQLEIINIAIFQLRMAILTKNEENIIGFTIRIIASLPLLEPEELNKVYKSIIDTFKNEEDICSEITTAIKDAFKLKRNPNKDKQKN